MAVYLIERNLNKKSNKVRKEYYSFSDDEHIVWDSEIDYYDEKAMQEIKDDWYQEYLDGLDEDEVPDDFETWYDDYVSSMYEADQEELLEELDSVILPKIENQLNDDILLLSGSYGSNYPDFRRSGDGGVLWFNGTDGLKDFMTDFDRVVITTQNGILGVIAADHDGTVSGQLFTLPDDTKELIKALGYEETVRDDYEGQELDNIESYIEDYFYNDLYYENIDTRDLNLNVNLLKPIKDTISGYTK